MFSLKKELKKLVLYFLNKIPWLYQDRIYYFHKFKKLPNIRHPRLFNEKILYRKFIYGDYLCYARLSDKFLVRNFIAETIGEKYLVPLIYETEDPLTLLDLPSLKNTVVKPNHGSNMVEILLEEPDLIGKKKLVQRCYRWLEKDFSCESREIHYRYIKPRILVEQFIGERNAAPIDYKFHMFNKCNGTFNYVLQVIYNRENPALSMNFYINSLCDVFYKIRDTGLDISAYLGPLKKVLELSQVLASPFDYVRVDWYIHGKQIYFGELTFTPGAGMVTGLDHGLNQIMGDMWRLATSSVMERQNVKLPTM